MRFYKQYKAGGQHYWQTHVSKDVINILQAGRGMAALAVVAHHAALSTDAFVGMVPAYWMRAFDLGAYGVDFFFVLSGFIIMHAHLHEAGRPGAIGGYVFKRLTRIFPAYWPVALALLGLYAALPALSASDGREFSVLSSMLLVPADRPPALSVAWTLVHELLFYAVFLLWFVSRRAFWGGLVVWAAAIAMTNAGGVAAGWLRYPLGVLNLEFMLGVMAAVTYHRGLLAQQTGMLIAGGGLLACAVLVALYTGLVGGEVRLVLALGLGLLMLGLAMREQQQSIAWPSLLMVLGNASYSIYLVHNPLLSVSQRLAGQLELTWSLGLLFGIFMSLLFGYLYYLSVERPVLRFIRTNKRSARI